MSAIKYKVNLTDDEKLHLEALLQKGKSAARSQTQARILLKSAGGLQDKDIINALDVSPSVVAKTRQRCVEEGPEDALSYASSFSHEAVCQRLKKHIESLAKAGVVYSRGQFRIRGRHGRRVGLLRRAL